MPTYKILILGASYGSLLATKLLLAGHTVKMVCLPAEADLINSEGFRVRMPVKGRKEPVLLDSTKLPGKVTASGAAISTGESTMCQPLPSRGAKAAWNRAR